MQQVEERFARRQEALRQAQSDAFAAAQQLTRARNEINALDLQKQGNAVRLEKLSAEKIQLEEERAGWMRGLHEFAANVEAEKLNAQTQRGTVEERQARLREIQEELNARVAASRTSVCSNRPRSARGSTCSSNWRPTRGFRRRRARRAASSRASVLGSLADRIRVPDQFVVADRDRAGPSSATGPDRAAGVRAADPGRLAASKAGRASVAALAIRHTDESQLAFAGDMAPGDRARQRRSPGELATIVHALSVIRADPSVETLFGVVARPHVHRRRSRRGHGACRRTATRGCDFVTLGGELLNRHGVYTGGYLNGNGNGKAPASILGRKNQIADCRRDVRGSRNRWPKSAARKGALQSEQTELQAGLQQAQTELRKQEVAIATREGEFNALQNSAAAAASENRHRRL